jgi:hypothetical protein
MQAEKRKQTNHNERSQIRSMKLVFIFCGIIAIFLLYMLISDFSIFKLIDLNEVFY